MPVLIVRATNPSFHLRREGLECTQSIIWHGLPVVPDGWSRHGTFVVRDGDKQQADGWTLPVKVVLRRANDAGALDAPAAAPATGRSGKLVVGSIYLGWLEPSRKAETPPAYMRILLESSAEEFDSIAAMTTTCDEAKVTVFAPLWFPECQPDETHKQRMLRTGLIDGYHPDGEDMIWDASIAPETEVEIFCFELSRTAGDIQLRQRIDAASARAHALGSKLAETLDSGRKVNTRTFWTLLILGVLGLLALLAK